MSNVKSSKSSKTSNKSNKSAAQKNAALLVQKIETAQNAAPAPKSAPVSQTTNVDGAFDSLKGRIDSRTHAIHVVLMQAFKAGRLMRTAEIVAEARELLGSDHKSYEKLDRTIGAHFNTMKRRGALVRDGGAWRLSDESGALATGAAWGAGAKKGAK